MRSLYFSLLNSHLTYGLAAWGNANKVDINKVASLQEKAIKVITKHIDIHFDLNIMNVNNQTYYQLSTLMWEYDYVLPSSLTKCFTRSKRTHMYKTCGTSRENLYHTKLNTSKYDIKVFKYKGVQVLNNLD